MDAWKFNAVQPGVSDYLTSHPSGNVLRYMLAGAYGRVLFRAHFEAYDPKEEVFIDARTGFKEPTGMGCPSLSVPVLLGRAQGGSLRYSTEENPILAWCYRP